MRRIHLSVMLLSFAEWVISWTGSVLGNKRHQCCLKKHTGKTWASRCLHAVTHTHQLYCLMHIFQHNTTILNTERDSIKPDPWLKAFLVSTPIHSGKSGPELAGSPVAGFSSCCLEAAPPRFQNLLSDVTPTPAALPSCCAASWGRGNFQTQCVNTQRGHRPEVRRQAASSRAEGLQGPAVPHRGCTAAILGPSKDRVALVVLLVSSVRVTLEKKHYHSPFHSPWIAITK